MSDPVDAAVSAAASAAGAANAAAGAAHSAAGAAAQTGSAAFVAVIAAVTALVTALAAWGAGRRKLMHEERSTAFKELMGVVVTLRTEIDTMRTELQNERIARWRAEDDLREVRAEVATLRQEVKRAEAPKPVILLPSG